VIAGIRRDSGYEVGHAEEDERHREELLLVILLVPHRRGERWAWTTLWILPAWAAVTPLLYVAFGTAADRPPAPPMISGPIIAVLAAAALLIDLPRFRRMTVV
jgi:hypothetical protein